MTRTLLNRLFPLVLVCLMLPACGYTLRGMQGSASGPLGDGTRSVRIAEVEHTTMFPWIPYVVHSGLADGINQRGLGRITTDRGDLVVQAKVTDYSNTNDNDASGASHLYTIGMTMEISVRDGRTNGEIWRSGPVVYSNSYQTESEATAVRDVAAECVRRALDGLARQF